MQPRTLSFIGLLVLSCWVCPAALAVPIEVTASQDLSVSRGKGERNPGKQAGLHPKKINGDKYDYLERFAIIRFDSKDFGKNVTAAAFHISAKDTDTHDARFSFRLYAVRDGDKYDEKFTEEKYDPKNEDSVYKNNRNMLDARQVILLGHFRTERGRNVTFTRPGLLKLIQGDTNGTVTLIVTRDTESPKNSTFYDRRTENPPKLSIINAGADDPEEPEKPQEPAEPAEPKEKPTPPKEQAPTPAE